MRLDGDNFQIIALCNCRNIFSQIYNVIQTNEYKYFLCFVLWRMLKWKLGNSSAAGLSFMSSLGPVNHKYLSCMVMTMVWKY